MALHNLTEKEVVVIFSASCRRFKKMVHLRLASSEGLWFVGSVLYELNFKQGN